MHFFQEIKTLNNQIDEIERENEDLHARITALENERKAENPETIAALQEKV